MVHKTRLKNFSALKRECYALLDLSSPVTPSTSSCLGLLFLLRSIQTDILSYDLFGWSTKITLLNRNYFFFQNYIFVLKLLLQQKLLFWAKITFLNRNYLFKPNLLLRLLRQKLLFWAKITFLNRSYLFKPNLLLRQKLLFWTKIIFLNVNYFFEPKLLFWTEITFLNRNYF